MLKMIANANAALAFCLELGVLAALCYWGIHTGKGVIAKIGLGVGAPVLAIVVWSLFGAPSAMWHLHEPWFFFLQVVFFGSAAVALFTAGQRTLGVWFGLIFVINLALIYLLGTGTLG